MRHNLICLVGLHGSGKSTIASALCGAGQYQHLSVGMLRRLALNRQIPADIPAPLIMAMGRAKPGVPLTEPLARKLLAHAATIPNCILDGFPASPEHLDMLPPETLICLVSAPAHIRHQRLIERAETSQRKWVDGKASAREDALPELIWQARKRFRVVRIKNAGNSRAHVVHAVTEILDAIS